MATRVTKTATARRSKSARAIKTAGKRGTIPRKRIARAVRTVSRRSR